MKQRPLLELRSVSRQFGGLMAVNGLNMSVYDGVIHGLIGPNGSGKSTTFNLISGIYRATSGTILFKGRDITRLRAHRLASLGIARTFQATDLFPEFTVRQNLALAAQLRARTGLWETLFCLARYAAGEREIDDWADEVMARLRLTGVADKAVRDLPHRDQKAVALANALATGAELLMLDEPAAGLTHQENEEMMDVYQALRSEGKTILLVEHNMRTVMGICERITVLNHGEKIAEGTPEEITSDPRVIEAYLGAKHASPRQRLARSREISGGR